MRLSFLYIDLLYLFCRNHRRLPKSVIYVSSMILYLSFKTTNQFVNEVESVIAG